MCFGHASVENGETIAVPLSRRQWSQVCSSSRCRKNINFTRKQTSGKSIVVVAIRRRVKVKIVKLFNMLEFFLSVIS
jgi:hypothetical protein